MYDNCNPNINYFVSKICDGMWSLKRSTIGFADLTFVIQGSAIYEVDGEEIIISAGEAVFIPMGHMRAARTDGMSCYAFNMTFECDEPIFATKLVWQNIDEIPKLLGEFGAYWGGIGKYDILKCRALFLEILHCLLAHEDNQSANQYIQKIKQYILERYIMHISVKDIAKYVGLNEVYCGALFRQLEGLTIIEYINRLRIDKAATMLRYEGCSVSQAAYQNGFEDVSYFCRVFKKLNGVAPSIYKVR